MQDNYKDFDLELREMMTGAEEQAPSGIWEAISSRLDAIDAAAAPVAPTRAPRRVWGWSAAALAMAAALVAGIFLFRNSDDSNPISINSGEYVADVIETPAVKVEPEISVAPESAVVPKSTTVVPKSAVAPKSAAAPKSTVVTKSAAAPEQTVSAETSVPAEASAPEKSSTVETAAQGADPFALMAYEDEKAASKFRVSSIFGGSVSSNNASQSAGAYGVGGSSVQHRITEKSSSTYGIPVSFGLGARMHFNDRWSVGTGVSYSMLTRTFDAVYTDENSVSSTSEIRHTMHYVGVPLEVFYNILNTNDISFYANAGGEAEYAVANKYNVKSLDITESEKVKGLQWSAGIGLGVEFNVAGSVNLFVEPKLKYYFNCDQPKNVRTEKPLQVMFKAGLRFDL